MSVKEPCSQLRPWALQSSAGRDPAHGAPGGAGPGTELHSQRGHAVWPRGARPAGPPSPVTKRTVPGSIKNGVA